MRSILRQIHLVLGLSAGLVLSLVGATGALMSFEEEIMDAMSRDRLTVTPRGDKLAPDALITQLREQRPGATVAAIEIAKAPERTVKARLRGGEDGGRTDVYVDPYDGRILGPARGAEFFADVRRLHRWLLLPGDGDGPGRQITAIASIGLLLLAATGLYLRWPGRVLRWAPWFSLDLRRPGRLRLFSLHAKVATFVLPVYVVSVLTGFWWSWDWYRDGATFVLTGRTAQRPALRPAGAMRHDTVFAAPAIDLAWRAFVTAAGDGYETALVTIPHGTGAIRIRSLASGAPHPGARDEWSFDPASGRIRPVSRHAERTLGEAMAASMLEVHRGRFFGAPAALLFCLAALAMPGFFATGATLYWLRRRARRRRIAENPARSVEAVGRS